MKLEGIYALSGDAKRRRVPTFSCKEITHSAVALHCGISKAHVQSQWKRANFEHQRHQNP